MLSYRCGVVLYVWCCLVCVVFEENMHLCVGIYSCVFLKITTCFVYVA